MDKAFIKLSYRQVIDAQSTGNFERNVLYASYNEFLLKSQAYNPEKKFTSFREMVNNDGRANSLHYKSGFAVGNFVEALNKKIPYLYDNTGKNILFENWQFELIVSDITNRTSHVVAINYFTEVLTLYHIIGKYLLLAYGGTSEHMTEPSDTFLLKVQPQLSITNYQQL